MSARKKRKTVEKGKSIPDYAPYQVIDLNESSMDESERAVTATRTGVRETINACRNYMFTTNNPVDADMPIWSAEIKRVVWQTEKGEEGTLHLQGYVELLTRKRITTLKKTVSWLARAHLEARRGTPKEAYDYCTKEDTRVDGPYYIGDWSPEQSSAKVSTLNEVAKIVMEGASIKDIITEYPAHYIRYNRGISALRSHAIQDTIPIHRDVYVAVIWGPHSGTGKTRISIDLAQKIYGEDPFFVDPSNGNSAWFNGYDNHKVIVLDDYRGWLRFTHLLRLLDGYKLRLDVKFGEAWSAWQLIIITSNISPDHWYQEGINPKPKP